MYDKAVYEERIAIRVARVTEAIQHSLELSPVLIRAADTIANTVLNDGKVLTIGAGSSAAISQIFVSNLMHRFDRERPGLPAIALEADSITLSSLTDERQSERYSRQIKALAKASDCVVLVSATGRRSKLVQAVISAHDLEIPVIALTGGDGGEIQSLLNHSDTEIRVQSDHPITIHELHLMLIHCLSELIDIKIFG